MAQTMYAHMNKWVKKKKNEIDDAGLLSIHEGNH
jgi:hypothetical protein